MRYHFPLIRWAYIKGFNDSVAEGMAKWASLHAIGVNVFNLLGGQFGNIYYCRKLIRCIYSQKCFKTRELGCSMQCYSDKGFKKKKKTTSIKKQITKKKKKKRSKLLNKLWYVHML